MQPTCIQIIRAIGLNLEEIILPALDQSHAKSAAVAARGLLEHVALRLEKEGRHLIEDNQEKRQLLAGLADKIENTNSLAQIGGLAELALQLREGANSTPQLAQYVSIDELTAENDALKGLLEGAIVALYKHHGDVDSASFEALRQSIRKQLRAQLDREVAFVTHDYQGWVF